MTKISWADITVNVIGGCTDADRDECRLCYARGMSHRLGSQGKPLYEGTTVNMGEGVQWTGRINCDLVPLVAMRNKKGRRIFLNSMSDWCHPGVPTSFIGEMWDEMARQHQHTFLLLTKRPGRIPKVLGPNGCGFYAVEGPVPCPQPNVWLGVSCGKDPSVWRLDRLREAPAVYRFVSAEPLLDGLPHLDLTGIDYVIAGGESGAAAKPMHPDWVRGIRDRCLAAGVAFEFKQWGEWSPIDPWPVVSSGFTTTPRRRRSILLDRDGVEHSTDELHLALPDGWQQMWKTGAKHSGKELDGREWTDSPAPWEHSAHGWSSPEHAEAARAPF